MGWRHMEHVGNDCAQTTHCGNPQQGMRSLALDDAYGREQIVQEAGLSGPGVREEENRWVSLWLAEQ